MAKAKKNNVSKRRKEIPYDTQLKLKINETEQDKR